MGTEILDHEAEIDGIVADLLAHLYTATVINGWRYPVEAVTAGDGTRFSVQAGVALYCFPRDSVGPWTHVEVMTLTDGAVPINWTNDADDNLAGYVDIRMVAKEIWDRRTRVLTVV